MQKFRTLVAERLAPALGLPAEAVLALLEVPKDTAMGDLAFPCFQLAKERKQAPPAIAAEAASKVAVAAPIVGVEAKGPYLNVRLDPSAVVAHVIEEASEAGAAWGGSTEGKGKTIVIDYSSPNIAKPFGIGHLRSTVIGGALYRIFGLLGYRVVGSNHLGDWGTQFGMMIAAWKRWPDDAALAARGVRFLVELYQRFHAEMEKDPALKDEARSWFKRLEAGDAEARSLWERFREVSLSEFKRVYDLLGVTFDSYEGEAFYNDKLDAVVDALRAKGLAKESQGALVVDLEKWKMPPCLLRKSDDASLYATRDLAAAIWRHDKHDADRLLYVVGADQKLHFRQLFKVLELMGYEWASGCVHVDFGLYRLAGAKMSTREKKTVLLEDVLHTSIDYTSQILEGREMDAAKKAHIGRAVGVGAIVFNDLKARRAKDVDFDLEQVVQYDAETKSFKGETGPYLQYAHTRLCGLVRQYPKAIPDRVDASLLSHPDEVALAKLVGAFPDVVRRAGEEYEPSLISSHLLDVSAAFNRYYHAGKLDGSLRVITPDEAKTAARMRLAACVRQVLATGLRLLGVEPLEEM